MKPVRIILIAFGIPLAVLALLYLILPKALTSIERNEFNAINALNQIVDAEIVWHHQGAIGKPEQKYWVYDVSCLNRIYHSDNIIKIAYIPESIALADAKPFNALQNDILLRNGFWAEALKEKNKPKSGYWFQAMSQDESGAPYCQKSRDTNKIMPFNDSRFAFVAFPDDYSSTGNRTFIVNEKQIIHARNMGSDKTKFVRQWPSEQELETKWEVVD